MTVSVVLATYNGAAYIQEQLESILEGERRPDELVVVDDGSTDGTLELVRTICHGQTQMRVVILANEKNIGASGSFKRGILESTGDVIFFADQDDLWMHEKVHLMMDRFTEQPLLNMAYSDGSITDAELRSTGETIFKTRNKAQLRSGATREPMEVAANPDIKGCTMALNGDFARTLFSATNTSALAYWGHDHWAALFAYGLGEVEVIDKELIQHRLHGGNASGGVRFNPLIPAHWRRYVRAARQQGDSYFVERYRVATDQAKVFGPDFDPSLMNALETMLTIAERRRQLHSLPLAQRFRSALGLYREGVYMQHYNGLFTLLRDVFL